MVSGFGTDAARARAVTLMVIVTTIAFRMIAPQIPQSTKRRRDAAANQTSNAAPRLTDQGTLPGQQRIDRSECDTRGIAGKTADCGIGNEFRRMFQRPG